MERETVLYWAPEQGWSSVPVPVSWLVQAQERVSSSEPEQATALLLVRGPVWLSAQAQESLWARVQVLSLARVRDSAQEMAQAQWPPHPLPSTHFRLSRLQQQYSEICFRS